MYVLNVCAYVYVCMKRFNIQDVLKSYSGICEHIAVVYSVWVLAVLHA